MTGKRTSTKATPKKRGRNAAKATPGSPAHTIAVAESDAAKARALVAFREKHTVTAAMEAAGEDRGKWYDWLRDDPAFASLAMSAVEASTDELEEAAFTRATAKDGSDTLLIFLLKSRRPEKYRETVKLDIVSPQVVDRLTRTYAILSRALSPEQWAAVEPQLNEVWQ